MSKKEKAFELFSQGKRPSDPEVKALGLSAKTRYNYFQEYKRARGASDNGVNAHSQDPAWQLEQLHQAKEVVIH